MSNSPLHAGTDERCLGLKQRHSLPLHVRSHQRAVGVIVLKERNECRSNRNKLFRGNVNEVDISRQCEMVIAPRPAADQIFEQLAVLVHFSVGLSDRVVALIHCRHVDDFVGCMAIDHPAIRAFNEAVLVDAGKSSQRVDQTNIRAFRRFNRADTTVMGRMHVTDFKAGPLTCQTTRAKRRKATLVGNFRQRVGLIHELAELRRTEKFANRSSSRLRIDQIMRHDGVDIDRPHTLTNSALHTKQANAILVFHQFADRTDTPVAEVINIVDLALAVLQTNEDLDDRQDVFLAQHTNRIISREIQAGIHLYPANRAQVIAF